MSSSQESADLSLTSSIQIGIVVLLAALKMYDGVVWLLQEWVSPAPYKDRAHLVASDLHEPGGPVNIGTPQHAKYRQNCCIVGTHDTCAKCSHCSQEIFRHKSAEWPNIGEQGSHHCLVVWLLCKQGTLAIEGYCHPPDVSATKMEFLLVARVHHYL